MYVEEGHDEEGPVGRRQSVRVYDVAHCRSQVEVRERDSCTGISRVLLPSDTANAPFGLPVVPLVCSTSATSLSFGLPLPWILPPAVLPPARNLTTTLRPSKPISAI